MRIPLPLNLLRNGCSHFYGTSSGQISHFLIWETVPSPSEVALSLQITREKAWKPHIYRCSLYTKGETKKNTTNGFTPKWAFCTTTKVGFVLETKQTKNIDIQITLKTALRKSWVIKIITCQECFQLFEPQSGPICLKMSACL